MIATCNYALEYIESHCGRLMQNICESLCMRVLMQYWYVLLYVIFQQKPHLYMCWYRLESEWIFQTRFEHYHCQSHAKVASVGRDHLHVPCF